jgi:putative sterol carrier protein
MKPTEKQLFTLAALREQEPFLRGVRGTYRFDIENVGTWFVTVDDGRVKVEPRKREADCAIRCSEEDFISIIQGKRNLLTAALQGRVQVTGDMALAQKFHGFVNLVVERQRDASERGAK